MNPEPTDRRDADALDDFWDELVLGQFTGHDPRHHPSPNEELVMTLHARFRLDDGRAEARLRQLVFGTTPEPISTIGSVAPLPRVRPEPIRTSRSLRSYSHLAAAAVALLLVGAMIATLGSGFFDRNGRNDPSTIIPAAISQIEATPAISSAPTNYTNIRWTLPFDGTNVEIGATALGDGVLYRLIRSDQFTGVQAVDTATGTEQWRSAQKWSGAGIGVDAHVISLLTESGIVALDPTTGTERWMTSVPDMIPVSLAQGTNAIYIWDGNSIMAALEPGAGNIVWQTDAGLPLPEGANPAIQIPIVTSNGIAGMSTANMVALFALDGSFTGSVGEFDAGSTELAATDDGTVIIAGALPQDAASSVQPWERKLMAADPASGTALWQADYNALITGLTVTDTMALVLADNPGLTVTSVQLANPDGTITTVQANPYPEQSSPYIYGFFLDSGQRFQEPEDPTAWNATGTTWTADPGIPPFIALAHGTDGPIGISDSGRLSFFGMENTLVQAIVDLPEIVPTSVLSNGPDVYVSETDGSLIAVAPVFGNFQSNPVTRSGAIDWSIPLNGTLIDFGGMTYGNGLVYRLIDAGAGRQIEATYASTGQPAWTLPFDWSTDQIVADRGPSAYGQNPTWTSSGNVFAIDTENHLIALDTTGTISWQTPFDQPVISMVFDTGTLFVWDESGTMSALNASDGAVLWATNIGFASGSQTNERGMPVPVTTKTLVAMIDAEGTLHGFDRTTGELLWSQSGFNGTDSRLVVSGEGLDGQDQWIIILSANDGPDANGNFDLTAAGILAGTGEYRWADYLNGPLVQPVTSDETFVTFIANEAMSGKAVTVTITPIVDAESPNHYVWTASNSPENTDMPGGKRLFAIDAPTGQIVWIRTSPGPAFTGLVPDETFRRGQALTADGLLVSPSGGNGWIDGEPLDLGGPVLATSSPGELGAIGSLATLADGTLVSYGRIPFSQQG